MGAGVTSVDGDLYPEVSMQGYLGAARGFASIATGPANQHSAVAGGMMQFGELTTTIDVRDVKAAPFNTNPNQPFREYRPFFQDERSINATVQAPFWEGLLSLRGSYGEYAATPDRYSIGISYNRPTSIDWLGSGILRLEASVSDVDTRVGIRFTLTDRIDAKSSRSATLGAESITPRRDTEGSQSGIYPVAQLG